jgi:protein-disulfide isomerase
MKEVNKFFFIITLFILSFSNTIGAENRITSIGNANAKINVKVFSSLTCPHCASFHLKIFENLKKDFIDKNLVKFEHHGFPLDLAALNAELIVRCNNDINKKLQLLSEIYKKQNEWAVGSDIMPINKSIKKIGLSLGLQDNDMSKCLENEKMQDQILNERIDAQKKYNINSTPTILINEKKYTGKHNYQDFKKELEKFL